MNGVLNEVHNGKNDDVDIQIVDVLKCFDKMNYFETANDMYSAGVTNDEFILMAKSNEESQVAIKSSTGNLTKRVTLKELEMQGPVPAPIKCSVSVDSLGKECIEDDEGVYEYKGVVKIPPLGFIDDVLSISKCGTDSLKVNALIQSKFNLKKLELGNDKCYKIHVGKPSIKCPELMINHEKMKATDRQMYLGDVLTSSSKIDPNIIPIH